jgi:RNA polymerase sigma-70 factor (ECF subfamily)
MLGSIEDSEDLVQETFLRAWRGREAYEGRATFRAWLYKIATNACLDALKGRPRRVLPVDVAPATDPTGEFATTSEHAWLEPYPDHLLAGAPDEAVAERETIELAFLAAMQHLPPRQRAVLILRDVVGWSADETAELLDLSVAAVKSALQRARATMRDRLPRRRAEWAGDPTREERALLARWVAALEAADTGALAQLLRADARVSFPPAPVWYDGREAFLEASRRHAAIGAYRVIPTSANLQPALAMYLRRPGDTLFRALALEVLRVEDGQIAEITDFGDVSLFARFGLADSFSAPPSSQEA